MDGLAQDAAVGVVERNGVFTIERSHVRQYELQGFGVVGGVGHDGQRDRTPNHHSRGSRCWDGP